jgi:hypothetical protein
MKLEWCTPSLSIHIFITPIMTLSGQTSSNFIKTFNVFIKIVVLDCILYYINNLWNITGYFPSQFNWINEQWNLLGVVQLLTDPLDRMRHCSQKENCLPSPSVMSAWIPTNRDTGVNGALTQYTQYVRLQLCSTSTTIYNNYKTVGEVTPALNLSNTSWRHGAVQLHVFITLEISDQLQTR